MASCLHCGLEVEAESNGGERFCCAGCEAAYHLVRGMGLERYYDKRRLDPSARPMRPDSGGAPQDFAAHALQAADGNWVLHLMVEGLQCAACVWLIESVLSRQDGVVSARLNMTTRRLVLTWQGEAPDADRLIEPVAALGYRLVPYDPGLLDVETRRRERDLLRAMAVAGFAAGNVMLLSISVWAGHYQGMGPATRDLLHWLSALIALPAIAYAGRPFFRSAVSALAARRVNMDVPISLAVVLAAGMSLFDTLQGREHAYFDSAIMLLFFLLIGRYLDQRARGKARSSAEHLLALGAAAVTVIEADGSRRMRSPRNVTPGMRVFVAVGDRIAVDGRVIEGASDLDSSLLNGETTPVAAAPGTPVFAGTLNLGAPLTVEVTAVGEDTLLAEIVRLVETAEQGRARYVALADRVARLYAPVVHALAALTLVGWLLAGTGWRVSLLNAIAVLIITCPCALGLAVPVVQVVTSGRLLRRGILIKAGTALERLAEADTVVFDKTGTLTSGRPALVETIGDDDGEALAAAAALAVSSRHPLARALAATRACGLPHPGVREIPGRGLSAETGAGTVRLGSRAWCGDTTAPAPDGPELWLDRPGRKPVVFRFADMPRPDAAKTIAFLQARGFAVEILSGDSEGAVARTAAAVGVTEWRSGCTPADKTRRLEELAADGRRVAMVGDGLNDAPALAAAHVSLSPSSAADVSQNAADIVFQGDRLTPVIEAIGMARRSNRLIRQNFLLAFLYNAVTVPLAVGGMVTPLLAAAAMSASSIVVIANALRLNRGSAL